MSGGIQIPGMRIESAGPALWRIAASVAGTEVFFESSVPLLARPEVLVCPFFLAAMQQHSDLEVAAPLSPTLLKNLEFIRQRAKEWWPALSAGEVRGPVETAAAQPGPDCGVFYTGGVDSSYALSQLHERTRYAVFVEGFDIPLDDSARLSKAREWLGATARACGVRFLAVRTNLREHPVFKSIAWDITHVAALAGVAHALGSLVHTMYVAASDVAPPFGSAPDLDRAWSSGSLRLENFGAELTRLQRAAAVARWQPVRGRLRVCWENNTADLNCGFCEKCVRTRMQLYVSGARDGLDSFPQEHPLRPSIAGLRSVETNLQKQWREFAPLLDDSGLRKEVERLAPRPKLTFWQRGLERLKRTRGQGA